MQSIQDILQDKEKFKKEVLSKHKYVTKEFQDFGYRVALKLGALNQVSMYIRMAKEKPRVHMEQALSFAIDYPNAKDKGRIFMWKLKELEKERNETLKTRNKYLRIILLDIDEVLILNERFSKRYSREFNVDIEMLRPFFEEAFNDCLTGKKDLKKVLKKYLKEWRWQGTADELVKYWIEEDLKYNQEMIDKISGLNKDIYKVYICTNQEKYRTEYLAEALKTKVKPVKVFSSCELKVKKKDPKFFKKVLKEVIVEPDQVYYIDNDDNNLNAAKKVGINIYKYPDQSINQLIKDAGNKP
ncbi:MAG: HAD-superfamily hydrolase, subfamily IA, variant 3 [candidate division WS6 bacterium GW2011_GWF2_39_15]|uniref:HAD-superfamily hydrolase, subfamily IA, variant 3 n=1 Tax=candidate division WS6 bacterium GW2011_GWF2_39_15 TaxID=1619100 RepID=A0A0G0MRD7_9BACT|nr:MAG: HAD-superfamily hydrolase, subfamily IA, variant 3 [candidate division WS6 bacterium GW2011_GWF2_39_15]